MYQYKVVISEEFGSISLTTIENLDRYKDFEIFVIGIYLNRIFDIFEIMTPMFHGFDDCKHLPIMDVVITFGRQIFVGSECYRMKNAVMRLANDPGDSCSRGIGV